MKYKIYLDNCCYNRPYDDQSQLIVKLETEAKLQIQKAALNGELALIWSFILHYENNDNPYDDRKIQIAKWEEVAKVKVAYADPILEKSKSLMQMGIRQKDALHIACAIEADADYFITTDKKLINKPVREVEIINPLDFLRRCLDED